MKTKIIYLLSLLLFLPVLMFSQISDKLTIELKDIQFQNTINGSEKIEWKGNNTTNEIGSPKLPVYEVAYVLPVDAKVTDITFTHKERKLLKENIDIEPTERGIPTNNQEQSDANILQKSKVYDTNDPYPNILYEIKEDGFIQGYHVLVLRIYPYQYIPKSKILFYYPNLEYTINYIIEPNSDIIKPLSQTEYRAGLCKSYIKSLVKNSQDVERFGSNVQKIINNNKILQKNGTPQRIKSLSVLDEITPDYIIVTNNDLKPTFQTLADWKTKKGIFTIIKTVEDIQNSYTGVDLQEKIRNYLIDCKNKWGDGLFVLLGGDLSVVPARFVDSDYSADKSLYPTDKYYSTSNNWSYNGTNFSRYSASTTQTINIVGRIPVSNALELNNYITKLIAYEHANQISNLSYYKNVLIADAFMLRCSENRSINGKSDLKSYRDQYLAPLNINTWLMFDDYNCTRSDKFNYNGSGSICCYDGNNPVLCPGGTCITGDDEFSKNNFISALNSGGSSGYDKFHIIYHMDHCGQGGMGTSGKDKGESIHIADFDGLNNGSYYQIMMSGGCHPADFAYDCMGKHYLTNQDKGGVAFIGNTDVGWVDEYKQFQRFCQSLYKTGGFVDNGRYDIGSVFQYTLNGGWRLHLLGDPEMQVWTGVPTTLPTPTLSSTSVNIGAQTVNITVSGLPTGTKGRICFWKGTEVYVTQENVINGVSYPISFTANTPGEIKVTVTAHNFKPFESIITVSSTNNNPNLSVSTVDFGDGIVSGLGVGNANGQNDAGETINLTLGIKNTGVNTANNVTATLSCSSPYITITSPQANLGNIAGGATITSNQFNYTIDKNAPEILSNSTSPVQFIVTMTDGNNTTWTNKYNIDVFNDVLVQCNKTIVSTTNGNLFPEAGETVTMNIALQNLGKALSRGLTAVLTSTNGNCTINSGNVTYNTIAPLEIKNGNAIFSFNTSTSSLDQMAFNLQVTNAYGKIWNFPFTMIKPDEVTATNIDFTASDSEIDLTWNAVNGVAGYNIYRCDVDSTTGIPTGNYTKLNTTAFQFTYYNDLSLPKLLRTYSYKITTLSTTGNESDGVTKIAWTSYPSKNLYPRQMDQTIGTFHTPINIGDINNDGKKEIFAGIHQGTYNGGLVCLDYYGNEPYNIDNNVTTYSGFAQLGYDTWAIPAIGDLKKTGSISIIEPSRAGGNNKIFCYSADDKSPIDGMPDLQWSTLTSTNQYLKGVVLSNIDNSPDGSLEIVTCSDERGSISTYNADGTLRTNIPCTNTYGSIAVADIDGTGKKIIQVSGQDINVWNYNGTNYKGTTSSLYHLTLSGYRFVGSVIVCDIDNSNDGEKEILTFAINSNAPYDIKLFAIKNDGTAMSGFDGTQTYTVYSSCNWSQDLSVGDLNNDGYLEVVSFATDGIKVWNHNGQLTNTISYPVSCTNHPVGATPILADIDSNHLDVEILIGSANNIYALKQDGSTPVGFPLRAKENNVSSIAVSDVDHDGKNEVISVGDSYMDMWQTDGNPTKIEWGSERHDQYNTGEYYTICDPTVITTDATWNSNQSVCGDLIVKSGTLTINNASNITLSSASMIIVMSGASLIIDAANVLNASIRAMAGSTVTIRNNGKLVLRSNAEFYTETGTNLEIQYGSVEK